MVKAAVMAGNRGGLHKSPAEVDVDGEYGMPLTHPAVIFPLVAIGSVLVLLALVFLCKFMCPSSPCFRSCGCCSSGDKDLELQLSLGHPSRNSVLKRKISQQESSSSFVPAQDQKILTLKRALETKAKGGCHKIYSPSASNVIIHTHPIKQQNSSNSGTAKEPLSKETKDNFYKRRAKLELKRADPEGSESEGSLPLPLPREPKRSVSISSQTDEL